MRAFDRLRRALAGLLVAVGALGLLATFAAPRAAAQTERDERPGIDVVEIEGLLDAPNAALVESSIARAEERGSTVLVFQVDSGGGLAVDAARITRLVERSRVPVAVWVGPSGAVARGAATLLATAAPVVSVSNGSSIGAATPVLLDDPDAIPRDEVVATLRSAQERAGRDVASADVLAGRALGAEAALDAGAITSVEPTLGEFLVSLDGRRVETAAGPVTLSTAQVVGEGQDRRRQPNQEVRFAKLPLQDRVLHTLLDPWVALFLFVTGLCLILFEFYAASVGIAGAVGGVALIGAFVGFADLPVRWWAVALLVAGILGLAVDLQAGGFGFWSVAGAVMLLVGGFSLYGGAAALDPAWWVVIGVAVGAFVFVVGGMTAMVRTRFGTPTVGREGIVGEMGVAEVDVAPDGVVRVRDTLWKARVNRATPITAGDPVRVVSVQGLVLEVEPEEGGARDYRDRARRRT